MGETKIAPIFLGHNATTPHDPEVIDAMRPYLKEHFGNPSRPQWYGEQSRGTVKAARSLVSSMFLCRSSEVVFTSGGTESKKLAINGVALAHHIRGNHSISGLIENPAVTEV